MKKYLLGFMSLWMVGGFLLSASMVFAAGNPYACTYPQIQLGAQGTCVQSLKWLLNSKMPNVQPPLDDTNGVFDNATKERTILWQTNSNLNCREGVAGPETWNSLVPGLNQTGPCTGNETPPTTGASADCAKLEQNFKDFGGSLPGPLPNNCYSAGQAVSKATKLGFTLVGLLAVLAIVIGGYRYVMSRGDEKAAGAGKDTIKWAVIGLVLVLFAYALVTIVTRLLTTNQIF